MSSQRAFRQSAFTPPPRARQMPFRHADGRDDPFQWLRDPGYPDVRDQAVLDYLKSENAYVDSVLGGSDDLRPALLEEFKALVIPDESPPAEWVHGRWYGVRYEPGREYPLWYSKTAPDAPETTILDANREAEGQGFYAVRDWAVSPDHRFLAILDDIDGSERLRLRIRTLADGKDVHTATAHCSPGLGWSSDSSTLFYTRQDDKQRPRWVHRHRVGTAGDDPLIYEETDPVYFLGIGEGASGRFLHIESAAKNSSETRLLSLAEPDGAPRLVLARRPDHEYDVVDRGEDLLIRTNDRHPNFRIVRAPLDDPRESRWQEVVAPSDLALISGLGVARDFWWLVERFEAQKRVRVVPGHHRDAAAGQVITFPDPAYTISALDGHQWDRRALRLIYESPARPRTWYDYDVAAARLDAVQHTSVPTHTPDDYVVERHWATARDGVRVPISLVRHRAAAGSSAAPVVLYGYGAYGMSMDAGFSANRIPFLRRGMIWAIAHIRGGQEMGRAWYDDGKLLNKRNTFDDFIACAEYLVDAGIAAPDKIAAMGGSAGGMLMGAVANQRPDLFAAILAMVPFVDVLSTMLDASLPLTPPEYVEWGNPAEPVFRDYMASYSPYDNVAAKAYPAMLISAGLYDPRVTYWEPAKWAAKLRAVKTDDNVLLLHTEMEAGHGGASGRYKALVEVAERLAFVIRALGLPAQPAH
ncbi:S9 family peptidase [Reyranella sp. CPCC 100927]|uniref:S9 family peptidase n=1 Tax=Reyranella sp. CPCC 100927 TaxID=2599616 RepID=UPI0011B719CD|nr:S9 family peptidase [Reyranella sp. CPCC 100927]TWT05694.1 S9 family peptidase [Reyranella sp. CPCC 100927]